MNDASSGGIHEDAFVQAFIRKERRDRSLFELREKRGHYIGRFSHSAIRYLDPRFVERIPPPNSDPEVLSRLLWAKGAKATCYAISSRQDVDSPELPLDEALTLCVGHGLPTILSCLPGRLCYLETEQGIGPPEHFILFRTSPAGGGDLTLNTSDRTRPGL
jgi:hypothetical protein